MAANITREITSIVFEDNEEELDVMELSVTNRNLQFVDDPLFQEGNEIVARFGYVWRFFSVVPTSRSERRHFGLSGAGRLRPEWRRWPQILFWGKGIGLPVELCFKGNGRDGSQLEFGFHIVTSRWTGPDGPVWMP